MCTWLLLAPFPGSIPVGQGYGLTETCAGGTFTAFNDTEVGRVGPPIPSNYVRVSEEGLEGG